MGLILQGNAAIWSIKGIHYQKNKQNDFDQGVFKFVQLLICHM